MSDEISVAPESAGAASTAPEAGGATTVTTAGPTGSTPETIVAQASPDSQMDAGWQLQLEAEAPQPEPGVTEDDAQFEAQLQDWLQEPSLDQERAPQVVEALKRTRAELRAAKKDLAAARRQSAEPEADALSAYGGQQLAEAQLNDYQLLLQAADAEDGAVPFLQRMYDVAQPALARLVDDIVRAWPQHVVERLRAEGALPEAAQPSSAPGILDPERLATVPEHLRPVVQMLATERPEVLQDLWERPEGVRNDDLESRLELLRLKQDATASRKAELDRQYQAAVEAGQQAVRSLEERYQQAHLKELSKWTPYGPEARAEHEALYAEKLEGAYAALLKDETWRRLYQDTEHKLQQAPLLRWQGQKLLADRYEQEARANALRINTRLGQLMAARIKKDEAAFSNARKLQALLGDERTRAQTEALLAALNGPSTTTTSNTRTEIPGQSAAIASNGKAGTVIGPDGRITPEYYERLRQQRLAGQSA